ncbi:hypothetical protein BVG16_06300 [Paenibacillus selenitireducens]|uniref:YetF C-terminal domain-containing protein n=1 Tax=Paenibacillus selenitireducens TaxID=1324314 RepID=A0A1T2XKE6_9BACL|nr:DUF421 domain-containing protein [Paenibacillus selenitireducens]OPA80340.1 hypothetical protein BVG16_06300 [Paenibacillus selenitireducens]
MSDWIEAAIRTAVAVLVLFFFTKLLGKRQVAQLSLFEYITGITIGSLAAYISMDLERHWGLGLISLGVWVSMSYLIEIMQLKSKKIRDFVDSKSAVLIKDGKILEEHLKKVRVTSDELLGQLRKKNVFNAADVEFAIMESNGEINVLLKRENQPLTPRHLGIKVSPDIAPQAVIMDGEIMDEPLATLGLSRQWLNTELEKTGLALENVFLGQVDGYNQLYVDVYDDQLQVPQPQKKAVLYATLKKCEADLEMFGLSTDNQDVKAMYQQCVNEMQQVISDMKPILTH